MKNILEVSSLSNEELIQNYLNLKNDLFGMKFQAAVGQLSDLNKIDVARRNIARCLTEMTNREIDYNKIQMPKVKVQKSSKKKLKKVAEKPAKADVKVKAEKPAKAETKPAAEPKIKTPKVEAKPAKVAAAKTEVKAEKAPAKKTTQSSKEGK